MPFRGLVLTMSGTPIPGAPLRLQSKSGNVYCDPDGTQYGRHGHTQDVPMVTWTVNHNLGFRPNINLYSAGGREMMAEVLHTSLNQTLVYFDNPTAGSAVCS